MGILQLIIVIAVFGLIVWGITEIIPMPAEFKKIIVVIAVIAIVFYVLNTFGILHGIRDIRIGK